MSTFKICKKYTNKNKYDLQFSLFYSTHEYFIDKDNKEGIFWIESNLAKIIEQGHNKCKVEVLSGKKGNFTLYYKNQDLESNLPIEIRSF